MRASSCDFSIFHTRTLNKGSDILAHLVVSLDSLLQSLMWLGLAAFVQNCHLSGVKTTCSDSLVVRLGVFLVFFPFRSVKKGLFSV